MTWLVKNIPNEAQRQWERWEWSNCVNPVGIFKGGSENPKTCVTQSATQSWMLPLSIHFVTALFFYPKYSQGNYWVWFGKVNALGKMVERSLKWFNSNGSRYETRELKTTVCFNFESTF